MTPSVRKRGKRNHAERVRRTNEIEDYDKMGLKGKRGGSSDNEYRIYSLKSWESERADDFHPVSLIWPNGLAPPLLDCDPFRLTWRDRSSNSSSLTHRSTHLLIIIYSSIFILRLYLTTIWLTWASESLWLTPHRCSQLNSHLSSFCSWQVASAHLINCRKFTPTIWCPPWGPSNQTIKKEIYKFTWEPCQT